MRFPVNNIYNMGNLLGYFRALLKRWWPMTSCGVFTAITIVSAEFNKSNHWIVFATGISAGVLFLVASFFAWNDEHKARIDAEARLSGKKNISSISTRLSQFLLQGQDVYDLCMNDGNMNDVRAKADQWHDSTANYLMEIKDAPMIARFLARPAQPMTIAWNVAGERNQLRIEIEGCMKILREFLTELKS